jgi:hypothetical protein
MRGGGYRRRISDEAKIMAATHLQQEIPLQALAMHWEQSLPMRLPISVHFLSVHTSQHLPGMDTGSIGALGV